jgi:hypothetical protein
MARASVSKTGGWGFESLHSCQSEGGNRAPHCQIIGDLGLLDPCFLVFGVEYLDGAAARQ